MLTRTWYVLTCTTRAKWDCSSCDRRLVVNSPTSNPRTGTSTTGHLIYVARTYICYQSSQRTLGMHVPQGGLLVAFSTLH